MWNGTARYRIPYLLKEGGNRAYLLHDSNGRYAQDAIPVRESITIYTDVLEFKTPPNCIKINATFWHPQSMLKIG